MLSILNRPFPPFVSGKRSIRPALITGLVVFAILFLFQPFGLDAYDAPKRAFTAGMYGIASFLVVLLFLVILPALFPGFFDGLHWTVGKEILFFCILLSFLSVANAWVNMWLQSIPFSFYMFKLMFGYTLLIGLVPVTFAILVKQQVLLRKYQAEAGAIEAGLKHQPVIRAKKEENEMPRSAILITGDNQGENLELFPENWLAAEANDNYTRIYFLKAGKAESVLFRCTLKKLEQALAGNDWCFRCHKSFLVNLSRVEHISGNAQGYRLHLPFMDETIPVSRGMNTTIREKLTNRRG